MILEEVTSTRSKSETNPLINRLEPQKRKHVIISTHNTGGLMSRLSTKNIYHYEKLPLTYTKQGLGFYPLQSKVSLSFTHLLHLPLLLGGGNNPKYPPWVSTQNQPIFDISSKWRTGLSQVQHCRANHSIALTVPEDDFFSKHSLVGWLVPWVFWKGLSSKVLYIIYSLLQDGSILSMLLLGTESRTSNEWNMDLCCLFFYDNTIQ